MKVLFLVAVAVLASAGSIYLALEWLHQLALIIAPMGVM